MVLFAAEQLEIEVLWLWVSVVEIQVALGKEGVKLRDFTSMSVNMLTYSKEVNRAETCCLS